MRKLSGFGPSLIVLVTAIIVLVAGPKAVWELTYAHDKSRIVQASEGLDHNPILQQMNQAYRDVAALVSPSVVHISSERTGRDRFGQVKTEGFAGSGWIYDEDGHIVTNHHVVERADRIEVQLNSGETRAAEIVGFDQFTDIAVLKVPPGRLFSAARATPEHGAALDPVRQGDLVFAFGSPFDFRFSMSSGVVSGTGRSVGVIRDERDRWLGYENFIQVDAAINRGNSGGPLTDTRGRVIGMNTAIATEKGSRLDEGQFAGVGLAIPIDMIEPVVRQLIATGSVEKGFLGVAVLDNEALIQRQLRDLPESPRDGLVVAHVDPDTPAWASGLRLGDVIAKVQGIPVGTPSQAREAVVGLAPDDRVALSVWRYNDADNTSKYLEVSVLAIVAHSFHGVELLDFDNAIGDWLKLLGYEGQGVFIARVDPGTPAHNAGLRCRDVVTLVDSEPVASAAQLRSRISSMMPGDVARLRVWRFDEQAAKSLTVTIDVRLDRLDQLRFSGATSEEGPEALRELGIALMATSSAQLAAQFHVAYHPGVLVQELVEGSWLAGRMEPGSVIVAVMDRPVARREDLILLLSELDLRRGARLRFLHPDGRSDDVLLRLQ